MEDSFIEQYKLGKINKKDLIDYIKTEDGVNKIKELYNCIMELEKDYNSDMQDRNKKAKELQRLYSDLEFLSQHFCTLFGANSYKYYKIQSDNELELYCDYKKLLNIILKIANRDKKIFEIKEIKVNKTDYSYNYNFDYNILLLASLDTFCDIQINSESIYKFDDIIPKLCKELIDKKQIFAMGGKQVFNNSFIRPFDQDLYKFNCCDLSNSTSKHSEICARLHNDDLMESFYMIFNFMKQVCNDFSNIDEDSLVKEIINLNNTSNYISKNSEEKKCLIKTRAFK